MKISEIAVKRPVFATMVVAALVVFGMISLGLLPLNAMPEVDMPVVTIRAFLPGADPETVETEVTDIIEESVNSIDSLKELRSTSLEGLSLIVIEFELEKAIDVAIQDVRDKIASVRQELPDQLEEPLVEKLDFNAIPVITLTVTGTDSEERDPEEEIRRLTEYTKQNIKERLQTLKGVGSVTMIGSREREIRIWLDADKMRGYGIPIDLVKSVLRSENVEVPGGRIETMRTETVVKTHGDIKRVEAFNELIVSYVDGRPVYIKDIGYVEDGMEDLRSVAYLNGNRSLALEVRKISGGNVVQVADLVLEEVDKIKQILPEDIEIKVAIDNSRFVRAAIADVTNQMLIGGTLAVLTILFFLRNFRTALIASIVLPTTVISVYSFINALGFTLNQLTMLALTISIGMLIDDAVVMIENIYHKLEAGEIDPKKAAITAAREIGMAIVTTSMTLMGVFVPVAFMTGIIGLFFYEFGLTVAIAVGISTFISLTLTPMLCSKILRSRKGKKHNIIHRVITKLLRGLDAGYRVFLAGALRFRFITILVAIAVFIGSMYLAGMIPGEFAPPEDQGLINVGIEAPLGSSIHETLKMAFEVEKEIHKLPGVDFTYLAVGGGSQEAVNEASIIIGMIPLSERAFSQYDLINAARENVSGKFPDLTIAIAELDQASGGSFSAYMVNYSLRGTDMDELVATAEGIKARMAEVPGFVDLDTSYDAGKPEIGIEIDRNKATDLGVSVGGVAFAVNALIGGEDVTTFESGGKQYDVRVRFLEEDRDEARDIEKVLVQTRTGGVAELSNLVNIDHGTGPVEINRRNRMREVVIYANLAPELTLGQAITSIDDITEQVGLPAGVVGDHIGMSEIMQESFESMAFSLMLAIVIIYMVLASLFESFIHPFTIMMSLPLSIAGAMGALLIAGKTLNILSMIGVIMLMGLVTKNAILLIDYTIRLRREGKPRLEALLEAGPRRLRPILMTTISTIAGSIPVALGIGEGASFRSPMGVVVIGGMITSTLLTLIVVPAVYTVLDDIGSLRIPNWLAFWRKKPRQADAV